MKIQDGDGLRAVTSEDGKYIFLVMFVETEGQKRSLQFRLTSDGEDGLGPLPSLAARALRDSIGTVLSEHIKAIRKGEYEAGYKSGRGKRAKRTYFSCTLSSRVYP